MQCLLCPRKCDAIRTETENLKGYCRMPLLPKIARAALHYWEEPCISGKNGSGTIFFSGCTLRCVYCQNAEISRENNGKIITVERLAQIFKDLEMMGAHNINLVTATHFVPQIIEALNIYKPNIPIVYNSSGYENVDTLKMLENYIDIYLLDFKYMSQERSQKLSSAADYPKVCKDAILEAVRQQPKCVFEGGIMKKGVIIRHLLLPQATGEAIEIFEWIRQNAPSAFFSIMSQYIPCGKALDMPVINRKITVREYKKVVDYILESGFENCYIQERSSASKDFVPSFDLTGI